MMTKDQLLSTVSTVLATAKEITAFAGLVPGVPAVAAQAVGKLADFAEKAIEQAKETDLMLHETDEAKLAADLQQIQTLVDELEKQVDAA